MLAILYMKLAPDWQYKFNHLDSNDQGFLTDALSLVSELFPSALKNQSTFMSFLSRLITTIDQQLSQQLDAILAAPEYKAMAANWLSLHNLTHLPVNYRRAQVKLLDMSWAETSSDLNQSYSIKLSQLYNKIANQELNTLGGHPFGCIVFAHSISMDIDFDSDFDDIYTLELLAKLGESCLCPMIFSPALDFFAAQGADWLSDTQRIDKVLNGPDYLAWQKLRKHSSSRFICLAMPRVKLRQRYKNHGLGFIYNQGTASLWGSAAFTFAGTILREYHRLNWFGFLKSRWPDKYQGAVINLPEESIATALLKQPEPDVRLFGELANFYAQQGFIPMSLSPLTNKFFFNGNNSIWQAGESDNDKVLTQLQTTLISCRIAHYLKVQVREMIGSFNSAQECETYLTNWIEKLSSNVDYADEATLAKYPLRYAKVTVREAGDEVGALYCDLRLIPQYQFDHFSGEVVLTTDLAEAS
ncbi:type VI secretion system contractile sheath large subunit [Motilimonas sp. 1_MG-2023]|nr:type VI secretion system contractile sheath large subunit [Motilimonas sp. 1_MG-2023]